MNHKPNPIEAFINFFYAIGLPPLFLLRGLISLLLIGLVIGGLYFVAFENPFKSVKNEDSLNAVEGVEESRDPSSSPLTIGSSLDGQVDDIYLFSPTNKGYLIVLNELESERGKINELLKDPSLTEDQKYKLHHTLIRHTQELLLQKLRLNDYQPGDYAQYKEFASAYIDGQDSELEGLASFSLVNILTVISQKKPSESRSEELIESLKANSDSYADDFQRANSLLSVMLGTQKLFPGQPHIDRTIQEYAKLLAKSETDKVKLLSSQITEFSLFADYDLGNLENKIRFRHPGVLDDLDNALRVLAEHPDSDIETWRLLIRAYEPSLSNGQPQVMETGWKIVNEIVSKIPSSDERKAKLVSLLENQRKRADWLGKRFEVKGETPLGEPITWLRSARQLVIFANRNVASVELLESLTNQQANNVQFHQPIVIFKDDFSEADIERIRNVRNNYLQIVSHEASKGLIEAAGIDFFPYTMLLDADGVVTELDLILSQAAHRIAVAENAESRRGLTEIEPEPELQQQ